MMTATLPTTPHSRLDGRRALITGAGRGIGLAAAAALAEAGAAVTLVARTASDIEAVADAIIARGGQADTLAMDVTDVAAVARHIGQRPAFDILVNNAGMNRPAPFEEVTVQDYDAIMSLNVRAAFFVAQAVARAMIASATRGTIINVSSQLGHVGGTNRTVYCATKFAIEGLTKAMAIDLAPHGIRVNTMCPTYIETPMTRPFLTDDGFRRGVLDRIKLGRLGTVEDVMGPLVFLASGASGLMTGSAVVVDGGWTAE